MWASEKILQGKSLSASSETSSISIFFYYLLTIVLYTITFSFWQHQPVPMHIHVAAVLLAATCMIPIFLWRAQGSKNLPLFELLCLAYIMQFSVPVYTLPNQIIIFSRPIALGWEKLYETLLYTEAGVIAFIISYYVFHNFPLVRKLPKLNLYLGSEKRHAYLRFALPFGAFFSGLTFLGLIPASIKAIGLLFAGQYSIAVAILAYEVFSNRQTAHGLRRLLFFATIYAFLLGLITGSLENALAILVLLLLVRWHTTRNIPWHWLLAGIVLFFILNGAKHEYRRQIWYSNDRNSSIVSKLLLWSDLATNSASNLWSNPSGEQDEVVISALGRFDLIHRFTYVRTLTPTIVPFYGGESYTYFLVAWVPRFLWPNKPVATNASQRMDLDYRLKNKNDSSSIGIGLLPEAYANFGFTGVIVILAIQGTVFAVLNSLLNSANSEGGRAIYLTIMIYFLNGIGSAAATQFGNIFQQVIAHSVIFYPFIRQQHIAISKRRDVRTALLASKISTVKS